MVSDGSSQQRLACPGRTVHENTFGLSDTQGLKNLRMFDGQFDNLLDLFDLLIESSDHVVGRIWDFFNFHEGDQRVNFGGEHLMENIVI